METPENYGSEATRRLTSWKEVAAYLNRDVRTVQRWEKKEGLPVHRQVHESRSSVYVTTDELDQWLQARKPETSQPDSGERPKGLAWVFAAGLAVTLATAGFFLWGPSPTEDHGIRIQDLLTREDIDGVGAPSWDGRFIPYRTVQAELWLYNIETGQSQRLRGRPESIRTNFLWMVASPEGAQVAYLLEHLDGGGELRILNADGSGERVLLEAPKYLEIIPRSWSTDGRFIAAVGWLNDGSRDILTVDVKTGDYKVLYNGSAPPMNAQISPDGKWVAFHEKQDIRVVASAGGPAVNAVVHPAFEMVIGWTPDNRLAFISDRSGERDVWVVPVGEDGEPELLWKNLARQPVGTTASGDFFYSDITPRSDLFIADLDETGHFSSELKLLPQTRYVGGNQAPDFSPDGRSLAYASQPNNTSNSEIRIRDLATAKERVLPQAFSKVDDIRWHPDGHALFIRGSVMQRHGFYQYSLDGSEEELNNSSNPRFLTPAPRFLSTNPTISKDGKFLYFLSMPDGKHSILASMDLSSEKLPGEFRVVVDPPDGDLRMFSLSPDGEHWALDIRPPNAGSRDLLYISDLSGGSRRLLTQAEAARSSGALLWIQDKAILYHRPDPYAINLDDLLRVSTEGGASAKLATTGGISHMAVHPDGTQVILQIGGATTHLTAIENLFYPQEIK